jgi:hypothetical protein
MSSVTVVVPMAIRRRGGRKQIFGPDGAPVHLGGDPVEETRGDPVLVKALARAFRWRRMLEDGQFATVQDLAAAEKINPPYVSRVLRLTLLGPDLVEAILDGRQPEGMTLPGLIEPFPVDWAGQRRWVVASKAQL